MSNETFHGFSRDTTQFLMELRENNNRTWFEANKLRYQHEVLAYAQRLVLDLGARLQEKYGDIHADPRTNGQGSIFRIYRDVRFSKDKSPYKTNLGIFFWYGAAERNQRPGFYFHLEGDHFALYNGVYEFTKAGLERYRQAVASPISGPKLVQAIQKIQGASSYVVGGHHYKRIPPGYDVPPDRAGYLCFNTIYTVLELPLLDILFTPELVDFCLQHYGNMYPLLHWLVEEMGI